MLDWRGIGALPPPKQLIQLWCCTTKKGLNNAQIGNTHSTHILVKYQTSSVQSRTFLRSADHAVSMTFHASCLARQWTASHETPADMSSVRRTGPNPEHFPCSITPSVVMDGYPNGVLRPTRTATSECECVPECVCLCWNVSVHV